MEESMQQPQNAQENAPEPGSAPNKKRIPTNTRHELYNANELLKQIMKDCIDEGM